MARLVFVITQDFGELFNAHYFLAGTPVEATLLWPPRLAAANPAGLAWPTRVYQGASELSRHVAELAPDVLLLFSGYLPVVNQLLSADEWADLLARWRRGPWKLVTSDPALGILDRIDEHTFSPRHPARGWLAAHFDWLAGELATVPHLYLSPEPTASRAPQTSFFNPRFGPPAPVSAGSPAGALGGAPPVPDGQLGREPAASAVPLWLFVISPEDQALQAALWGAETFASLVAERLADAERAGAEAVLIAPPALAEGVRARLLADSRARFVSAAAWAEFLALLGRAEQVFYWNLFSASILARVVWGQPFQTFDRGHLVRAMPPVLEVGRRHFYGGHDVDPLDLRARLSAEDVRTRAEAQQGGLIAATRENLARSPRPEDLVARWLAERAAPPGE